MASDSPLEELEHHEHLEHAEHAAHSGDKLISNVTFTIAVLAVLAAIAASLETTASDAAIVAKNDAVLAQDQATDAWNLFEAKSLKKNIYQVAAAQGGPNAADFAKKALEEGQGGQPFQDKAEGYEAKRDKALESAEVFEARHSRLTVASTLLHMAIAIATLSIILHRRWPWFTALALSAAGLAAGAWAYL